MLLKQVQWGLGGRTTQIEYLMDHSLHSTSVHWSQERERFTACRALLRDVLSRYLMPPVSAREVVLNTKRRGKPVMTREHAWLQFNISHTGDLGLIAISNGTEVGIDAEQKGRRLSNIRALAKRRLSARECQDLYATAGDPQDEAFDERIRLQFLRVWTRKEAFVKCTGLGISSGLRSFEVSADAGEPRVLSVDGCETAARERAICDIDVPDGYVASLVAKSNSLNVEYHAWREA